MFFFLFAAVVLVLAFAPAKFRKLGFAFAGIVAVTFLVIVIANRQPLPEIPPATEQGKKIPAKSTKFDFDKYERDKKDKEDPEAKTRIPVSEIRFDQVKPIAGIQAGTIRSIRARMYNDSHQFTLTDYWYYLVIQDCLPEKTTDKTGAQCTTVYDQRDSASLTVPPNQARDIVISIPKDPASPVPFKLLGTPRVQLAVTDTRAYQ